MVFLTFLMAIIFAFWNNTRRKTGYSILKFYVHYINSQSCIIFLFKFNIALCIQFNKQISKNTKYKS